MANRKPNPFAQDFQSITESADDAVMQFLKQGNQKESAPQPEPVKVQVPEVDESKSENVVSIETAAEKSERKEKPKSEKKEKPEVPRQKPFSKPKEWGRPTALFNTRIPQEMAELLDDLVYRLKKEGKPHTKQTIAIEALESYLAKSGLIDAPERRTFAN